MTPQKSEKNLSFIVLMLFASISAFITAILIIFGRYLEIGYKTTPDDISYAGMQIWDLHQVFTVITLVFIFCALVCFFWQKLFKKVLSLPSALLLLLLLMLWAVTFFPYPFEFQLRYYASASKGTYIILAQNSGDFIDGNEDSFAGSKQTGEVESFYDEKSTNTRNFNCVTNRAWWWRKLAISQSFYPILDKKNHLSLLEKNCKEITHE
ncbi:MAG: hypothetical protein WBP13_03540 [Methylophilaceae bacterium]